MSKRTPTHAVRPAPTRFNWLWLSGGTVAAGALIVGIVIHGGTTHTLTTASSATGQATGAASPPRTSASGAAHSGSGAGTGNGAPSRGGTSGTRPGTGRSTPGGSPSPGRGSAGTTPGGRSQATIAAAKTISGVAQFYDPGSAVGSCLLGPFQAGGDYVSLPAARFDNGAACGTSLEVRGPRGTVLAEVVDLCPACAGREINLSQSAFQAVAGSTVESARVHFHLAVNPPLHGNLRLSAEFTSGGLSALRVFNTGNELASVAVASQRAARIGTWHTLRPGGHGFWLASAPITARHFAVRLIDVAGHKVTLSRVRLTPGVAYRSHVRMYASTAHAGAQRPRIATLPTDAWYVPLASGGSFVNHRRT